MKVRRKPIVLEAEQVELNLIPCMDGMGYLPRRNPFNAIVMRRPRWWKLAVPMIKTDRGWIEVFPYDWILKHETGTFGICRSDKFGENYEQIN